MPYFSQPPAVPAAARPPAPATQYSPLAYAWITVQVLVLVLIVYLTVRLARKVIRRSRGRSA